ncbi:DUF4252 domain-containing protein [Gilvimarinus sp. SDUM040013]|uniref:DUF4252 domain-containing protein n=1 Tax=Gilvimarinus gilvus TaxID=3058038 RepID=A0ABU4S1Q6_9GAMM|nr:DUF4252 domain-containing protein [Gilvimarinus sp. SDUM040013]MDO3384803.1 DUF4252 domain-containing protein [Gilvimarinus sp. SDUM040013]MDX6850864.1 DUF4252 domain-containing protein [Gilvimarinus sp. SDUM040013]
MKSFKKSLSTLYSGAVLASALLVSVAAGASPAGSIDFADLSSAYGEAKVEINLPKSLINMVGTLSQQEDPEIANVLNGVDFIKVRVYQLNGEAEAALKTLDTVTSNIRKLDWQPIVSVNEEKEKVRIFSKMTENVMDGLVVMVVDENGPGEAVFINIVGQIDPNKVGAIANSMNIDLGDI